MAVMNAKKNNSADKKKACLICKGPVKARMLCGMHLARFEKAKKEFAKETGLSEAEYDRRAVAAKKVAPKDRGGRPRTEEPDKKPDSLDLFIMEMQAEFGIQPEEAGK